MIKMSRGCCDEDELSQVREAFEYGYFGLAYKVNQFESELQTYLETDREVIALNTGTTALHVALDAVGVGVGDEVILPSFTFVATAQAISACGAKPVFCDVYPCTLLMDVDDVERRITDKTKAIIPVHYSGNPCDMQRLMEIKTRTGIRIIEDAAHAIGSDYDGRKIGAQGDITCFSFDSIKVITCGEGGALVTDDIQTAELVRKKRLLGIDRKSMHVTDWKQRSWEYDVTVQGYRYHMSNINAAIGLAQLKKIDRFIRRRREICDIYDRELAGIDEINRLCADYDSIAPFMYVIKLKNGKRNELKSFLQSRDIESGISYIPCHHFSLYRNMSEYPVTDSIYPEILCLPIHVELTDEDILTVTGSIKDFLKGDSLSDA